MKRCNNCNMIMGDSSKECSSCGNDLSQKYTYICNKCGQVNDKNLEMCPKCGASNPLFRKHNEISIENIVGKSNVEQLKNVSRDGIEKIKAVGESEGLQELKAASKESIEKIKVLGNTENVEKAKAIGQKKLNEISDIAASNMRKAQSQVSSLADEINSIKFSKKDISVLGIVLALGLCIGLSYGYISNTKSYKERVSLSTITSNIKYGRVTEKAKDYIVKYPSTVRSNPSILTGKEIAYVYPGQKVESMEKVASIDKDKNLAVTSVNVEFKELFKKPLKLPKGTAVYISRMDNDHYVGDFTLNGKSYTKKFKHEYLTRAYIGDWLKVKYNGNIGYVPVSVLSEIDN